MAIWMWSQTAATNGTADSTCPFPEGMAPAALNDGNRGMMAAVAKYRDDIAGAIVTAGTNVAYTVSSYSGFDTLPHLSGQVIAFSPHATNGATVTLNVDSLGAKPLRLAPGVELPSGAIIQGTPYVCLYNNTDGAFYLQGGLSNPYNIPLAGGIDYWGPTAPNSAFAFPSGQAISRTTYATLFALVGTTFGVGDGSTTFNIPDKRGCVSAGQDNFGTGGAGRLSLAFGAIGGAQAETIAQANLPAVTLGGSTSGSFSGTGSAGNGQGVQVNAASSSSVAPTFSGGSPSANLPVTVSGSFSGSASVALGGSGTPISLLQPTIACNYILRII